VAEYRKLPNARWRLAEAEDHAAQVLTHLGRYDEALELLHESETISREVLGEDNLVLLRALQIEAYANCLKGDYAAAETTLSAAEAGYQRKFPSDTVNAANLADMRCMILTRTGRVAEGERFGREATETYQRTLSRGANGITLARIHWAENLAAQQRFPEAERLLLGAYKDSSEIQGPQHVRARQAAEELAKLYAQLNRPEEADRYAALSR
jgi:tetratricopeptide (TPR) repeat protein